MKIDERLIPLFEKIDFANQYVSLCKKYNDFDNRLINNDANIIKEVFEEFHLPVKYIKGEKFFKVEEDAGLFKIQFKTVPSSGFLQFLFTVHQGKEKLQIAMGMWEVITRALKGEVVRKPIYTSEEELKEILNIAVKLYQDFKTELENQS